MGVIYIHVGGERERVCVCKFSRKGVMLDLRKYKAIERRTQRTKRVKTFEFSD